MDKEPVLIIGGGISGLSVAWWLSQQGIPSQIWEAAEQPGGKIATDHQEGYLTERAASIVMNYRTEVNEFIEASGLSPLKTPRSASAEKNRYLIHNDSLVQVPSSLPEMLNSPLWSLQGKARLAAELFIPKKISEQESVSSFIQRRFGSELLEKAMEPFVGGTLASDPDHANAYSVLPRLTALEKRYGSISAGMLINKLLRRKTAHIQEAFSFEGGMSTLIAKLAQADDVDLRCGYRAKSLKKTADGWQVWATTPKGDKFQHVSQLVVCAPAPQAANLLSPHDNELGALLRQIRYAPLTLVHLGMDRSMIKHPLDGSGFLTPRSGNMHINGNLWLSRLFPGRAPKGKLLLTSYLGGARNPQACEWDTMRSVDTVIEDLSRLFGSRLAPEMMRVDRHKQALPLYHGDYFRLCRAITERCTQHSGLYLAANYIGGVSVRDRLLEGRRISLLLAKQRQPSGNKAAVTADCQLVAAR
ncbi:MAG: protoporphyrinogen oxidase [Motiliproteus sp.]